MKKLLKNVLIFVITLTSLNSYASSIYYSDKFEYRGLKGRVSNLTNISTNDLKVIVEICKIKWNRKCKTKKIQSNIDHNGQFSIRSKTISKDIGQATILRHYLINKKTDEKYELIADIRNGNIDFDTKNFTVLETPHIIANLHGDDGSIFENWENKKRFKTLVFKLATIDFLNGEENNFLAIEASDGKIFLEPQLRAVPGYLTSSAELKLKAMTFGKTEESVSYLLNQNVRIDYPFHKLEDAINNAKLTTKNIDNSIRGIYSIVNLHDGKQFSPRRLLKNYDRVKSIKEIKIDCEDGDGIAYIDFDEIGKARLLGTCDNNGNGNFKIHHTYDIGQGLIYSMRGEFNIRNAINGQAYAEVIDENGDLIAHYQLKTNNSYRYVFNLERGKF